MKKHLEMSADGLLVNRKLQLMRNLYNIFRYYTAANDTQSVIQASEVEPERCFLTVL